MNNNTETNTKFIDGTAGGRHIVEGPITTGVLAQASPSLLRSEIDSRIVKICPMSTPVDQISRMIGARQAQSMKVEFYSVDTKKPSSTIIDMEPDGSSFANRDIITVKTNDDALFAVSETLLVPELTVVTETGNEEPMVLYVTESGRHNQGFKAIVLNGEQKDADATFQGLSIVRMGRAASELDVQTPQFGAVPVKSYNYCQIFKAQVEQSLLAKLSAKEVGWSFSDQEEVAVMDMRLGMEKNFLFGTRMRITDPQSLDDTLFTGGIWNQAEGEIKIPDTTFDEATLVRIMRAAFTGNASGSSKKILIGGAGFIEKLNTLSATRFLSANDKVTRWGIDFSEINSKFGTLYVIYSEIFDQCAHSDDALVIDPAYLSKYVHVPFRVDLIDMQKTGTRNTQALVATEASCLVLRHPKAHVKVLGQWNKTA